jgi:hypothetical protein
MPGMNGHVSVSRSSKVLFQGAIPDNANEDALGSATKEWLAIFLGQNAGSGVYLGLGQEGRLWYDQTSNKHVTLTTTEELYFSTSKTMAAAADQSFLIDTALTLGAARTTGYGTHFGQTAVTLGGHTLGTAYTVYVGAAPTNGTAKYSLGVAGAVKLDGAVTLGSTLTVPSGADIISAGAVNFKVSGDNDDYLTLAAASHVVTLTATGSTFDIASATLFSDDISLANTKNLLLYATASEYVTLDGDGYQGMTMLTDAAAPDITFLGFSANAAASTNKDGGSVIVQPGVNETGGTGADGTIQLNDADGTTCITVGTGLVNTVGLAPSCAVLVVTAATLTLDDTHCVLICDTTSNAIALTLPAASAYPGKMYTVFLKTKGASNNVTIVRAGSDTIWAASTTVTMDTAAELITLVADGVDKWILPAVHYGCTFS